MVKHAELWRRYKVDKDQAAREELLRSYLPLVRHVAQWLSSGLHLACSRSDLESFGLHGLLSAVDNFEPSRGIRFEHYASQRVRGAMLDGVRADSWAPSLRRKQQALDDAYCRLQTRLGREPEDEELAAELGLSPADLERWQVAVGALSVVSLDAPWQDDEEGLSVAELLVDPGAHDPETMSIAEEDRTALAATIEALPERERLLITLVYFQGVHLKQVAQMLGVSLSRASQLHSRALLRLRAGLKAVAAVT